MQKTLIAAVTLLVTTLAANSPSEAYYCEAWSNQKVGWARGWGRATTLDRAKRLALGNCFARSTGRGIRCRITRCTS